MNTRNLSLPVVTIENPSLGNTYFTTSEIAPAVVDGQLQIINWKGISRSWGTPSVKSQAVQLNENVLMVSVVGWHKHTVSPVGGNFYFVNEGGEWIRRTANHKAVKAALANQVKN